MSWYLAGTLVRPGTLAGVASFPEVAGAASSPESSGWLNSHSTARSAFPDYSCRNIITKKSLKTKKSSRTVSRRAFRAWALVKPMSASIAICSGLGSGPLLGPVGDETSIGSSISTWTQLKICIVRWPVTYRDLPYVRITIPWPLQDLDFLLLTMLFDNE